MTDTPPQSNIADITPPFESYEGKEPFIFISYAHKDSEIVYEEIAQLHRAGYRIWYDEGIGASNEWPEEIANAVIGCSAFLAFVSPQSTSSVNCRNEINLALNEKKPFLAIHIEDSSLPPGLRLRMGDLQAILRYKLTRERYVKKVHGTLDQLLGQKLDSEPTSQPTKQKASGHKDYADAGEEDARRTINISQQMRDPKEDPVPTPPDIPDYELIRMIGKGSFGQVWVALDATGSPCALKIIYKGESNDDVFWKEFEGVRNYLPVSRSNLGLVTILHVGKDPENSFYYYTMELADNSDDSQVEDWPNYEALSLSTLIEDQGKPCEINKFREIALNLSKALAHLHEKGLVHRDIKPSNIIFVNGAAKIADVGLVSLRLDASTFIGTTGYIPPEGPGKPAADVYALGKTLYELLTGKSIQFFPELPTLIPSSVIGGSFASYNLIIGRACTPNHLERIQDGQELLGLLEAVGTESESEVKKRHSRIPFLASLGLIMLFAGLALLYDYSFKKGYFFSQSPQVETSHVAEESNVSAQALPSEKNDAQPDAEGTETQDENQSVAGFFLPRKVDPPLERENFNPDNGKLLPRVIQPFPPGEKDPLETPKDDLEDTAIEKEIVIPTGKTFEWPEMKLKMPWIPPGSFLMGSLETEKDRDTDESPRKLRTISKGFWLCSREVPQSLYSMITNDNPSKYGLNEQFPVENLSWLEATDFCNKLTDRARTLNIISDRYFFSLPTEAEWEYACRAGTQTPYSFGETLNGNQANFKDMQRPERTNFINSPSPIGSYLPNKWGLFDMHGNVAEWTSSWYHSYSDHPQRNSSFAKGSNRVVRGGAWNNFSKFCRSAYRNKFEPTFRSSGVGLRISLKRSDPANRKN